MKHKRVAITLTDATGTTTYFGSKVIEVDSEGKFSIDLAKLLKQNKKLKDKKK